MARITRKQLIEESGLSASSATAVLRRLAKKAKAKGEAFGQKDPTDSNRLSFDESEAATIRETLVARKASLEAAKAAGVVPSFPPRRPSGEGPPETPDETEPKPEPPAAPKGTDERPPAPRRQEAEPPEPRALRELARQPGPTVQVKPKAPAAKVGEKKGEFFGLPVYAWLIIGGAAVLGLIVFIRSRQKGKTAGSEADLPPGSAVPPPPPNPYTRGVMAPMSEAEFRARYPELFDR
jgi:hypothetical protein